MENNLKEYSKEKFTPIGIALGFMFFSIAFMLLLEPYIWHTGKRFLLSIVLSLFIMYSYATISERAESKNGSPFAMIIRLFLFISIAIIVLSISLFNNILGLIILVLIIILFLILKEKSKSKVIQEYSTRDLIYSSQPTRNIVSRTFEKLGHEVILGPGYNDKRIKGRVEDIKRAMELGATETSKGIQESNYVEIQSQLNLIHSKLANISNEEFLYNLNSINRIKELEQNIQLLTQGTQLSNLINEVQKNELLIQIGQYKIHLAKLSRVWQNIHQPNSNYETGFE